MASAGRRSPGRRRYSASQPAMSAADGIRPALTTRPSITRPGVDMTPRAAISRSSVTWRISASTPAIASASRAFASTRRQFAQPDPSTSTTFTVWTSLDSKRVEQEADGEDAGDDDTAEDGDQAELHDPAEDHELGQADRDDRHHEGERGPQRHALAQERLDDRDRACGVRVERDRDGHHDRDRERVLAPADLGNELGRNEAVDERPDADPDDHVEQDPPNQVLRGRPGVAHALLHREADVERRGAAPGPDREDPGPDPLFEGQAPEDEPAHDGDREPGPHVEERDPGPEQAPEQDEGDLVDHRAADEEREGHAERDPGLHEANEERHRGARAERRDDPECGRPDGRRDRARPASAARIRSGGK